MVVSIGNERFHQRVEILVRPTWILCLKWQAVRNIFCYLSNTDKEDFFAFVFFLASTSALFLLNLSSLQVDKQIFLCCDCCMDRLLFHGPSSF